MFRATKQLNDRIAENVAAIRNEGQIHSSDSIEWRKIGFDIDRLIGMNPAQGWFLRGAWHALNGNLDGVTQSFGNLYRLTQKAEVLLDVIATYASVGCLKPALPVYNYAADPVRGVFKDALPLAVSMGAIRKTAEYIDRAGDIDLTEHEALIGKIRAAAGILEKHSVTDKMLSDHMDLAGHVIREAKRFQTLPNLHMQAENPESILIEYIVDGGKDEATALNLALTEKEKAAGIASTPAYSIVFSAGK